LKLHGPYVTRIGPDSGFAKKNALESVDGLGCCGPLIERRFRRAAAFAAMLRDKPSALYVELFFLCDTPLVKAASA